MDVQGNVLLIIALANEMDCHVQMLVSVGIAVKILTTINVKEVKKMMTMSHRRKRNKDHNFRVQFPSSYIFVIISIESGKYNNGKI